ncbi:MULTISPECIES: hypothetical protein [unclassified Streptomyces]|uniref:hypothetical protein n=1 Tax=unclassified Streptomyces TaxID=2593676 RepID=UPI00202F52D7|nr:MULTISPECIES: hypothetical protein [unclassified Streptomyces]MCM1972124.1 hypothetical protein [Streptomyces sp. G1]MCX5125528.1 hypothetical protein [Streptomyces sp. NBC_00347]MCX5298667.1 hypothetical protein [Streptomyces sp. NBC_00193]
MKKNTEPQAAAPAHSAPHLPAAPAAPAQVPAAPGEPRGVFRFALSVEERTHSREDYAPVR